MEFEIKSTDLLVVIDVQNDFLPGGALAVPDGNAVIPVINGLIARFEHVALTEDWHPQGHLSFASSHPGKAPFDVTELSYGSQVLWPDHCVKGSWGAEIACDLGGGDAEVIIRKGYRKHIDSYSAFLENDKVTPTGLAGYMKERGLKRAVFVGLALDYCVAYSALDAVSLGFESVVVLDGCRGISTDTIKKQTSAMTDAGVLLINSAQLG